MQSRRVIRAFRPSTRVAARLPPWRGAPSLVVRRRRLPLLFRVQVGQADQLADASLHQAGRPFVVGPEDLVVLAQEVLQGLAPVEQPGEVDAHLVAEPFADRQHVARSADGLLDQGRGGGPPGFVERGLMQQRQDALEGVVPIRSCRHCRRPPLSVAPVRADREPDRRRPARRPAVPPAGGPDGGPVRQAPNRAPPGAIHARSDAGRNPSKLKVPKRGRKKSLRPGGAFARVRAESGRSWRRRRRVRCGTRRRINSSAAVRTATEFGVRHERASVIPSESHFRLDADAPAPVAHLCLPRPRSTGQFALCLDSALQKAAGTEQWPTVLYACDPPLILRRREQHRSGDDRVAAPRTVPHHLDLYVFPHLPKGVEGNAPRRRVHVGRGDSVPQRCPITLCRPPQCISRHQDGGMRGGSDHVRRKCRPLFEPFRNACVTGLIESRPSDAVMTIPSLERLTVESLAALFNQKVRERRTHAHRHGR